MALLRRCTMPTIGELHAMPKANVYRRTNGDLYLKLNEKFHVKTRLDKSRWLGAGSSEELDPNEEVMIIQ